MEHKADRYLPLPCAEAAAAAVAADDGKALDDACVCARNGFKNMTGISIPASTAPAPPGAGAAGAAAGVGAPVLLRLPVAPAVGGMARNGGDDGGDRG